MDRAVLDDEGAVADFGEVLVVGDDDEGDAPCPVARPRRMPMISALFRPFVTKSSGSNRITIPPDDEMFTEFFVTGID